MSTVITITIPLWMALGFLALTLISIVQAAYRIRLLREQVELQRRLNAAKAMGL